jgi:hypothetical protein
MSAESPERPINPAEAFPTTFQFFTENEKRYPRELKFLIYDTGDIIISDQHSHGYLAGYLSRGKKGLIGAGEISVPTNAEFGKGDLKISSWESIGLKIKTPEDLKTLAGPAIETEFQNLGQFLHPHSENRPSNVP